MYEEDKLIALDMYREMFDSAEDEQQLSQLLVSPTRQAVVIARAYNQRERRLQVHSQTREESLYEDAGTAPEYVSAIDNIRLQVLGQQAGNVAKLEEERRQYSLFSDEPASAETPAPAPAPDSAPAPRPIPGYPEAPVYTPPLESSPSEVPAAGLDSAAEAKASGPVEADAQPELSFYGGDPIPGLDDSFPAAGSDRAADTTDEEWPFALPEEPDMPDELLFSQPPRRSRRSAQPQRQLSVPLLVLYIIFAIPLTLLGVLILLVPTVLSLALSGGSVALGVAALSSVFGGFSIFADLMVVLGAGLILLALGLLFLWLFVWLIGGAIASFVSGMIQLGNKLCSREVED